MWECTIDEHIKYIFIYYPTPTIPTTKPYFHTLKQVKQAATLQYDKTTPTYQSGISAGGPALSPKLCQVSILKAKVVPLIPKFPKYSKAKEPCMMKYSPYTFHLWLSGHILLQFITRPAHLQKKLGMLLNQQTILTEIQPSVVLRTINRAIKGNNRQQTKNVQQEIWTPEHHLVKCHRNNSI